MKQWKRLLTIVLVGVLALTVLAGCSGQTPTNSDEQIPNKNPTRYSTTEETMYPIVASNVIDILTGSKPAESGCNVDVVYSQKMSVVAGEMLKAVNNEPYFSDKEDKALKAFKAAQDAGTIGKNVILEVGYFDDGTNVINPAGYGSYQYESFYSQAKYADADTVGIAYNGSSLMIIAVKTK